MIQIRRVDSRGLQIEAKLVEHLVAELGGVPLVGMLRGRGVGLGERIGDGFGALEHEFFLVAAFEERAAQRVNRFALLVHHVVVFEQVFAGLEVLRFDGFLRVLDALADEARLDGHAFGHAQAEHQGLHALAAENAQQIVFERKEEARRAWIALAAGASAELIVDAPRLVAFGAENMQPAHGDDFVMLGLALLGKLVVDGLPLIERHLEDLAFLLEENHGGSGRAVEFRDGGLARGAGLGGCAPGIGLGWGFAFPAARRSPLLRGHRAWPACSSGSTRASSPRGCRRAECRFRGRPCWWKR